MAVASTENKEEIIKTVKDFIVDNFLFGNEAEEIQPDTSFMEKGIIDSTGILELVEFTEETYEISVEDEELLPENLDSLNNISTYIISKKQ